nr:hypothetical protein [Tanacetum cinerariifolium]
MVKNQNDVKVKQIRIDNETEVHKYPIDEIGIDNSSRHPPDEFLQEDDPSRQYQTNSNISYYIIPHGRSLTELTHEKHVPKVIALNEQDNPQIKDVKGLPDQEITKATQEQGVQDGQINHKPTKEASKNNTKTLVPITETLVPEAH